MFLEGVRVLPDLPKNMPNLEALIKEFETGFGSMSIDRQDATELSIARGGNFVRKIVQAYESNARASTENVRFEQNKKKYDFSNTLETIWNRKNAENVDARTATNGDSNSSSQCWKNFKEKFKVPSAPFIKTHGVESFAIPNRCHTKSNDKTVSKKQQLKAFSNSSRTSEMSNSTKKPQLFHNLSRRENVDKRKNKKPITCSSPLEDVEDKGEKCQNILEILTNSCDSNSTGNSSYKNLRVDLYDFENEGWHLSLSSASSFSSRLSCDGTPSTASRRADYNPPFSSYLEDTTVISERSDNITNDRESDARLISSSGTNWKSPRVIGASLKRPIKIDDDTCVTWIPALGEQLPRERSLKRLLSEFSNKLSSSYRKIGRRLLREWPKKQEYTPDSGYISELFPSSLSSSSSRSWHSDPGHIDERSSMSPTFRTFGRTKSTREYRANDRSVASPRMVLTDVPREMLTASRASAESTPRMLLDRRRASSSSWRENRRHVDSSSSSRNSIVASSPKSKIPRRSFPNHLRPNQNGIPKYPSVARTIDQAEEKVKTTTENLMRDVTIERRFDVRKFEPPPPPAPPLPISERALNISYPRITEWMDSSLNSTGSRLYKSTSALDSVALHRQAPIFNMSGRLSSHIAKSSSVIYSVPRIQRKRLRYATVNPKNLRFSISREKSRAIEMSFDI